MLSYENMIRALFDTNTSSSDGSIDIADDSSQSPAHGELEFIGFLLWYIAMIVCCIVPTLCAYRKRRRLIREMQSRRQSVEIFLHRRPDVASAEGIEGRAILGSSRGNNVFIQAGAFEAMYYGGSNQVLALESLEGETACSERRKRLENKLKSTTFVVREGDIINFDKSSINAERIETREKTVHDDEDTKDKSRNGGKDRCVSDGNTEEDIDIDQSNTELRLPIIWKHSREKDSEKQDDSITRNKTVPGVCAICLCAYEIGDRVTYSQGITTSLSEQEDIEKGSQCPHAFHTDCILQWLAKKNDARPECPCCRRSFCKVAPLTNADLLSPNPTTTARGTDSSSTDGSNSRNASAIRTMHQIPMIALPVNNNNRRSRNNQEQPVMVLFPWP